MTEIENQATCPACARTRQSAGLCLNCEKRICTMLDDLYDFWDAAHYQLQPSKGQGGKSSELSIGINVSALSFIGGQDILNFLHSWESWVRQDRKLTPPAFIKKPDTLGKEIQDAIDFAKAHLSWSVNQDWFSDFDSELKQIHNQGRAAAKVFVEKKKRIPCPGETQEGLPCGFMLTIRQDNEMLNLFTCGKCKTEWTSLRLVAVALSDPKQEVWLDLEAIANWLGISERHCRRLAKANGVSKRGRLFNLKEMRDAFVA